MLCHFLLASMARKSGIIQTVVPLQVMHFFLSWHRFLCVYTIWSSLSLFLICRFIVSSNFGKFSTIISLKNLLVLYSFPSPSRILLIQILYLLLLSHTLCSLHFSLFSFCCPDRVISIFLPSSSQIFFLSHIHSALEPIQ